MSQANELSGPDLSVGVDAGSLRDGEPLLGHAGGEAVMLVKAGGQLFANAATCTHYGGPLAEGLVVGKTVRCPWHHACFDLENGHAKGPALNSIACFDVIAEKGLVRVGKKREPKAAPVQGPSSVVIIGAGPAGAACAETLRREGYTGPITLIGDEAPGPVDRPNLSKDYLAGNAPEEWIPLRDGSFYQSIDVKWLLGQGARSIDVKQRSVTVGDGSSLPYGALLLATGAAPRKLDIPGAERAHVLRTLADSRALIAAAKSGGHAVVIGASFIGLEVAASLRAREVNVDVVAPEKVPLARVVGDKLGQFVLQLHEQHGVKFHLGHQPARIEEGAVVLDDGTRLQADLIVTGVGVAPRTSLAEAAGLKVERGVVVDERLRTSDPNVYAAGDVASYPDARFGSRVRIEHWAVAERQGQAVALSMLGKLGAYRELPFFWSAHYDKTLSYIGHAQTWDRVRERGSIEAGAYVTAFEQRGKVLAVITLGEDKLGLELEAAMEAGDDARVIELLES
jgi:NADPH-dependent 2,4-dienoyl-CoA reductase/sulfur reductase-like enzyme/nitrite reductase/ring-hydroxylating ferredoxin subunit